MITEKEIIEINQIILNQEDTKIANINCSSCLSSYIYYDKIEEQIASIVYGIVKNHYFIDGNKRTALAVFYKLCKDNNISLNSKNRADSIQTIASSNLDIKEVTKLLF